MGYLDHDYIKNIKGYTYNPESGELKDRLRLELGDTDVSLGSESAVLSDAEYNTIIALTEGKSFNQIKIKVIEVILAKLNYEVSFSIDGMSYNLSERVKHWKDMLKDLKKISGSPPDNIFGKSINAFGNNQNTNHYFRENMLTNDRRWPPDD